MIAAHRAFDVQTTLARITRLRVDTRNIDNTEVRYTIGFKWDFVVDEEDLRRLYNVTDCDSEFKRIFEELKATCLSYNSFKASR